MSDFALVVGIERYAAGFAPLKGPGLDALRFTLWLHAQGVPAANILLFHNKCDDWAGALEVEYQQALQRVTDSGVIAGGEPSFAAIRRAWRERITAGPPHDGTLWIYWSGHGVTFPKRREALMCSDMDARDPTYLYVSELRDSLHSEAFRRFHQQRVIIDACAEHVTYDDLKLKAARNPDDFETVLDPEHILLAAAAVGTRARNEEGGGLFTRLLLARLTKTGWPNDIRAFHVELDKDIEAAAPGEGKESRLSVLSPRYEFGVVRKGDRREQDCLDILKVLGECKQPYSLYQPYYVRTIGSQRVDSDALAASSASEMLRELLDLEGEAEFGGYSRGVAEWLLRIHRSHPKDTAPIGKWLGAWIPEAGRLQIQKDLDKEDKDLALVFVLTETPSRPDGLPATIGAQLCDASFSTTVKSWGPLASSSRPALEDELRLVLRSAGALALRQRVTLTVHVFANPPLLDIAYHALRVDPQDEDCQIFGELYPFILRSRARLHRDDDKYQVETWRMKAKTLRTRPASAIPFHEAPPDNADAADLLAKIEGLLSIQQVFAPSIGQQTTASPVSRLLVKALRRGLPLVAWRIAPPEGGDWPAFEKKLKEVFEKCQLVGDVPRQLRDVRQSERWARQTVLLWDDDDADALSAPMTEEPYQQ